MKADITRLSGWGKVAGIIAGVFAIAVFGWLLLATNMSRPVSQMPWYYWLLITLLLLVSLLMIIRPRPETARIFETSVTYVVLLPAISAISMSLFIASLVTRSTTGLDLFMALAWLPSGIRGAQNLFQRWQSKRSKPPLH
jgi:phosphatidylserine synthase